MPVVGVVALAPGPLADVRGARVRASSSPIWRTSRSDPPRALLLDARDGVGAVEPRVLAPRGLRDPASIVAGLPRADDRGLERSRDRRRRRGAARRRHQSGRRSGHPGVPRGRARRAALLGWIPSAWRGREACHSPCGQLVLGDDDRCAGPRAQRRRGPRRRSRPPCRGAGCPTRRGRAARASGCAGSGPAAATTCRSPRGIVSRPISTCSCPRPPTAPKGSPPSSRSAHREFRGE